MFGLVVGGVGFGYRGGDECPGEIGEGVGPFHRGGARRRLGRAGGTPVRAKFPGRPGDDSGSRPGNVRRIARENSQVWAGVFITRPAWDLILCAYPDSGSVPYICWLLGVGRLTGRGGPVSKRPGLH